MKKLAVFFICVIIACCSCLGCGNDKPENNGTRVVKDAKGYEVKVPAHPMRIVSFSISCDEILLGLVEPERIASVSYLCDDAGISHVVEKSKAVKERIKGTPSVERIMALKPDLVILGDWWTPDSIQTIRDMGISVYVYKKLVDCLEKCLICRHIRRFADWFYYSFTTFNELSLDMQKAPADCRIDRCTTLRGTSKRKNKISTTYKAAFLTPTQENRNAAFFMPSCYAVRANKALIYAALRAWK